MEQEQKTRLDLIPDDLKLQILDYLSPIERIPMAKLNSDWTRVAFIRCRKIAFYPDPDIIAQGYFPALSRAFSKLAFKGHTVFRVTSWAQVLECITICCSVARIESLKIIECRFQDTPDWTNIGENFQALETLALLQTSLTVAAVQEIVSTTRSLVDVSLSHCITTPQALPDLVRFIFAHNSNLTHFRVSDVGNQFNQIVVQPTQKFESIFMDARWRFDEAFCQSLQDHCAESLQIYGGTNLSAAQAQYLNFTNLTEIRLVHISPAVAQMIGGEDQFPNLKAFTLLFSQNDGVEQTPCIYNQSPRLEILNTDARLEVNQSVINICQSYQQLRLLRVHIPRQITNATFAALKSLRDLVYLDLECNPESLSRNNTSDLISSLPNLRVIGGTLGRHSQFVASDALYALFAAHPDRLFFVREKVQLQGAPENYLEMNERLYAEYFRIVHDPAAVWLSYFDWEIFTPQFLESLRHSAV